MKTLARLANTAALGTAAAIMFAAMPAGATIIDALTMDQLVARAEHILVATVTDRVSQWDGHGRIVTDVTLRVERSLKEGTLPEETMIVRRIGGEVGEIGMAVAGAPSFALGGRYLLFLERRGEHLRVVGMSQGVMQVRGVGTEASVYPGGSGLMLVQRSAAGTMEAAPGPSSEPQPLERVVSQVRALVGASVGQ